MQFITILLLCWSAFFNVHCEHQSDPGHHHSLACLTPHVFTDRSNGILTQSLPALYLQQAIFLGVITYHHTSGSLLQYSRLRLLSRAPPLLV